MSKPPSSAGPEHGVDAASSATARRNALFLGCVVLVLATAHGSLYAGPFDDSFITYRYARNLARGFGLVYNPGEIVEGYTSFVWTLLLALVQRIGAPPFESSVVLSATAALAVLVLTLVLHRRAYPEQPIDSPFAFGSALLVAASGTFAYYAMTGMETTLFSALLLAALVLLLPRLGADRAARAYAAGAVLAIATMTRPEGISYAGLVIAALFVLPESRPASLRVLGAFCALFVPYFIWRTLHFGHLAPNTYYAKATLSAALAYQGVVYVESFVVGHGFIMMLVAACVRGFRAFSSRSTRLCLAVLVAACAGSMSVGGDTFAFFRFLLPAIPVGSILLAGELGAWALRSQAPGIRRLAPVYVLLTALVIFLGELVPTSSFLRSRTVSEYARCTGVIAINDDYFRVGRFLREHATPGTLVALNAAGIVPFESDLPTIDMLGLTDEHIAHRPIELGHFALGHERYDADYVLSRRPGIILPGLPQLAPAHYGPGDIGRWYERFMPYLPGDQALSQHPLFRRDYRPMLARIDGRVLYAFVRRDAPAPTLR